MNITSSSPTEDYYDSYYYDSYYIHYQTVAGVCIANLVLAIPSNALLLLVLRQQQQIQDTTRLLYYTYTWFNLAVCIIWCSGNIYTYIDLSINACLTYFQCFSFPENATLFTAMFILCLISLDKYIYLSRPLRYYLLVQPDRVKVILFVTVLLSLLLCTALLPFPSNVEYFNQICKDLDIPSYTSSVIVFSYFIGAPVVVAMLATTFVNIAILRIAYRKTRSVGCVQLFPKYRQPRRFKGVLTTIFVTTSFNLSWLPWLMYETLPDTAVSEYIYIFGASCGWLYPLLYISSTKEARSIIKRKIIGRRYT